MDAAQAGSVFLRWLRRIERYVERCPFVLWVSSKKRPMRLFFLLMILILFVWVISVKIAFTGDTNGGSNSESVSDALSALFSGLAFAGMFCALIMQKRELALQREELAETRKVLKDTQEETERLALATEQNTEIETFKQKIATLNFLIEEASEAMKIQRRKVEKNLTLSIEMDFLKREENKLSAQIIFYTNSRSHLMEEFAKKHIEGDWRDLVPAEYRQWV